MRKAAFVFWGLVFGFALSRSGASEYDLIYAMFTGRDFTIALVILTAIVTAAVGLLVLKALATRPMPASVCM